MQRYIEIYNTIIYTYGVFSLIGVIISFILVCNINKREKIDKYDLTIIFFTTIIAYILGSKITNMIENKNYYFTFLNGYTYTGGLLFGIINIWTIAKIFNYKPSKIIANLLIIFPTIYFLAKIGCFVNGCCNGNLMIPIQLIESILGLILSIVIYILKYQNKSDVIIISMYIITYGICRFIIDFFRIIKNNLILNLSITQIICLLFIFIGTLCLLKHINLKNKVLKECEENE